MSAKLTQTEADVFGQALGRLRTGLKVYAEHVEVDEDPVDVLVDLLCDLRSQELVELAIAGFAVFGTVIRLYNDVFALGQPPKLDASQAVDMIISGFERECGETEREG